MASLVSILFIWIVVYFCSAYYQAKVLGIPWHRLHVYLISLEHSPKWFDQKPDEAHEATQKYQARIASLLFMLDM